MRKIIGFHKWQEKKGQAGKKFIGVVVEDNVISSVFEDVPPHDIHHRTILIFGKIFDITYPTFRRHPDPTFKRRW